MKSKIDFTLIKISKLNLSTFLEVKKGSKIILVTFFAKATFLAVS